MKTKLLMGVVLMCGTLTFAQNIDPVLMTINGKPILRSEFEYSFNKNNGEGVVEKKSVDEYVPLFVNYKLKVEAAKDAGLDTMLSFKQEFAGYRDQQIRPAMISEEDVEAEARKIYGRTQQQIDNNGGLARVAHILIVMKQQATQEENRLAKVRIDSVYDALKRGADFATLAGRVSQDPGSAGKGGELPPIAKGQTFKEFEDVVWSLRDGEMSAPFMSPAGWHIILKKGHSNFYSYDSQRDAIIRYIDQRGLREQIINAKIDTLSKQQQVPAAELLKAKQKEMEEKDPSLRYLIKEYYDGLLLYEISNRTIWEKAQKDERGLTTYFKKNKKMYKWEEPRFKGMAYHTREKKDVKAVVKTVKGLPFDRWAEKLRSTFNADSVLRIKVELGMFKKGDNAMVDHQVFKVKNVPPQEKDYPYANIYGKKLKRPKEMADVRSLVVADYQDFLERQWVDQLREKYQVVVDENVLKTVNKHE